MALGILAVFSTACMGASYLLQGECVLGWWRKAFRLPDNVARDRSHQGPDGPPGASEDVPRIMDFHNSSHLN